MSTLSLTNCICRALFSAVACDEAQDWARRIHLLMISGLHPLPWKNSRSLNVSLSLINMWIDGDFYFIMDAYSPIEPLEWHHFLLVPIVPFVPMDHWNCPVPSQTTWENNLSLLNEMHIHQQNHWNKVPFYWYQSYYLYQWTIGIALYPAKNNEKII